MAYINPSPGVSGAQVTLTVYHTSKTADASGLVIPALQNVTINAGNDVFTWTQLDSGSKKQIATTATNSLAMNLVVDPTSFFPGASPTTTAATQGLFGLSKNKTKVFFELVMGDTDGGVNTKTISGEGYITGLAPTVSADSPVWVTPITITVTGDYTVATTA
jgi:hypothetical protein